MQESLQPIPNIDLRSECIDSFILGKYHYDKYRQLSGLDISNFLAAISALEVAKIKCRSHEYEDDTIYSLANAYFYTGEFIKAQRNYRTISVDFPSSSFNTGLNTAAEEYRFLANCSTDNSIDYYRKAEVYELHKELRNAIIQYRLAKNTKCMELSRRSTKKARELEYMLE